MASSSSGGSGSGGTSGGSRPPGSGGYSSGQPPRGGGSGGGGGQSPYSSSGRPTRPTTPAGQERTVSYQREEERYWTDYLRVALPVIGLLLMLGLFWFWAQSLIGDDDDEEPTQVSEVITQPSPTPTTQQPVDVVTTPGGGDAGQTDGGQEAEPTETPTEEADETDSQQTGDQTDGQAPTDEEPTDADVDTQGDGEEVIGLYAEGDEVVVDTDGLNMRDGPSANAEVVITLPEATELTVIGPTEPGDQYNWVPVRDLDGNEGYVAEDFLAPST